MISSNMFDTTVMLDWVARPCLNPNEKISYLTVCH